MDRICPKCIAGVPHSVCIWMFRWVVALAGWILLIAGIAVFLWPGEPAYWGVTGLVVLIAGTVLAALGSNR